MPETTHAAIRRGTLPRLRGLVRPLWSPLLGLGLCAATATPEPDAAAVTRGPLETRKLALVFTGHEFAEGASVILDELAQRGLHASFFLTGHFLTNAAFKPCVRRILNEGHYLGPHSDKHLLYCTWENRATLVDRSRFRSDLEANYRKIEALGRSRSGARYFLPPFEHYNEDIARWSRELGVVLVNYTPGTRSHADYTPEGERSFISSQAIYDSILEREKADPRGLNGFILLFHLGAGPGRKDKFHTHFGEVLRYLTAKGYETVRIDELLSFELQATRTTAGSR